MPLLSATLPPYSGPHGVGAIDLEIPVEQHIVGKTVHADTAEPIFKLETVLFTLYYPTSQDDVSSNPKHPWVPKPIALHGEGYARFAHMSNFVTNNLFSFGLWLLAGSSQIPADVDAPLLPESSLAQPIPVVVFSHGMASSRTASSQYCGELASQGYIVAAIEHRDGSGPGSMLIRPDGSTKAVFHVTLDKLRREPSLDEAIFKEEQLAFRQAEVEETIRVLRQINEGLGAAIHQQNSRGEGHSLDGWKGRLDTDGVIIGGHSFGGTTALRTLRGAPTAKIPAKGGIILDPGKQSGPLNDEVEVPILIVHSTSWSKEHSVFFGRPHFEVVRDIAKGVLARGTASWFMTCLGTSHPSVTDAPLIEPMLLSWTTGCSMDVHGALLQYARVSLQFLHFVKTGQRTGVLAEGVMSEDYTHSAWRNSPDRSIHDEIAKYWQIHVAPEIDSRETLQ